jgi:hypothetical protein
LLGARASAGFYLPGQYCPDPLRFLPYPAHEPEVRRYLRLVEFLGWPAEEERLEFPILPADRGAFKQLSAEAGVAHPQGYVCVHPGAHDGPRRWAPRHFAAVADGLADLGFQVVLTGTLLLLGALNLRIVRAVRRGGGADLLPLGRFAEAELGIGFTVLLTAASLTSMPPAIDIQAHRVTAQEIIERMTPRLPRFETPPLAALSPASPLALPQDSALPGSFVPGQFRHPNTPADIAWSEYNHHWAGLVVLMIGLLALLSRRLRWARHWPLAFFGLAVFLLIRSDSENWPLGPRGFWESFQVA